jgi:hypothetical protein
LLIAGLPLSAELEKEQEEKIFCHRHEKEGTPAKESFLQDKIEEKVRSGARSFAFGSQKSSYLVEHEGAFHYADIFLDCCCEIQLSDGSRWHADSWMWYKTALWSILDPLMIVQNKECFSSYSYWLLNLATNTKVKVNLIAPPYVSKAYWVQCFDDYLNELYLQDGSLWKIDNCFTCKSIMRRWLEGDVIIIGTNDSYGKYSYPHILINARTGEYVEALCIF